MEHGMVLGYDEALREARNFVSDGASPEEATERVFSGWNISDDALKQYARTGLTEKVIEGIEESRVPA